MRIPTVTDLTVDEFRDLVHEVVVQSLTELLADPDEGMVLRDDFAEELRQSLKEVEAGGKTKPLSVVWENPGSSG